jgi:predicted alpha/beta-fold hydrolase
MHPTEVHDVTVSTGSAVRLLLNRPAGTPRGVLVILHGVGGNAESHLARRAAVEAWQRGWVAARMNFRTCGQTGHLATTLYNAGMSGDLAAILARPPISEIPGPKAAMGYSYGANVTLKYLGESARRQDAGDGAPGRREGLVGIDTPQGNLPFLQDGPGNAGRDVPHLGEGAMLAAAVAVSPPIDLSVATRHLRRTANLGYQTILVLSILRGLKERHRVAPDGQPSPSFMRTPTLISLDETYTAPDAGYESAEAFYRAASPGPLLHRIDVPTLLIASRDDPVIPTSIYERCRGLSDAIEVYLSDRGGHCGWMERKHGRLKSWLPSAAMDFIEASAHS